MLFMILNSCYFGNIFLLNYVQSLDTPVHQCTIQDTTRVQGQMQRSPPPPPDWKKVKRGGPGKYTLSSCTKRCVVPYLAYSSTLKTGPIYFSKKCLTFTSWRPLFEPSIKQSQLQHLSQCLIPALSYSIRFMSTALLTSVFV